MKSCGKCKLNKSFDEFTSDARRPDGLHLWCKDCKNTHYRSRWFSYKLAKYNLTVERYKAMTAAQSESCKICKEKQPLCIDHDHTCCPGRSNSCGNCIRGLICTRCNKLLGMVGDDPSILESCIQYLYPTLGR